MRIYPVIKNALDEIYDALPRLYDDRDAAIWDALDRLTRKYENLEQGVDIDYGDAATQFAYLYKYAGSRACAVYSRHVHNRTLNELLERESLKVTCLGAGPGSDLLGLLRCFDLAEDRVALEFNLIDGNGKWKETARLLRRFGCEHLPLGEQPQVRFRPDDLLGNRVGSVVERFAATDLFTASYLISEFPNGDRRRFLDTLISKARPGTVFLIIDNSTNEICTLLSAATRRTDLDSVRYRAEEIRLLNEDVKTMGCHFKRFGDYKKNGFPNVVLKAAWFVAVKK